MIKLGRRKIRLPKFFRKFVGEIIGYTLSLIVLKMLGL